MLFSRAVTAAAVLSKKNEAGTNLYSLNANVYCTIPFRLGCDSLGPSGIGGEFQREKTGYPISLTYFGQNVHIQVGFYLFGSPSACILKTGSNKFDTRR